MKSFMKNFTIIGLMLFVFSSVALAKVGVKFTPISVSVPSGSDFSFNVELYSDVGEEISSYNVLLKYDPAMVTAKSVQDETFANFMASSNVGFDKDASLISQLTLSGKINVPKDGIKVATVVFSTKTGLALGKSSSITVSPAFGDFAVLSAGGIDVADMALAKSLVVTIAQAQDPAITVIYPTNAALNETLIIRGSNFGTTPVVKIGGKEISAFIRNSDTEILVLLPTDASIVSGTTKVQVRNASTSKLSNEYSQNVNTDVLVIDDIEGGHVNQDLDPTKYGYYKYKDLNGAIVPVVDTTKKMYGDKGLKMQYSYVNGTWGHGAGAALINQNLDLSNYNALSFMYIGDGTDNFMRVDIIESDGDQWMGQLIPLKATSAGWIEWSKAVVSLDAKNFILDADQSKGDKAFSKKIQGYKFTYVPGASNNTTTKHHYIDQVQAEKVSTENKTSLISVDPIKLDFTALKDAANVPAKQAITLKNLSLTSKTAYSILIKHYGQTWFELLSIDPSTPKLDMGSFTLIGQVELAAGQSKTFDVEIKTTKLLLGTHIAQIVFVDNAGKQVNVDINYKITDQATMGGESVINSVIPSSAFRGGTIVIKGSNLSGAKITVGGIEVTPFASSDTEIKTTVPTSLSGDVAVKAEKNGKTSEAPLKVNTDLLVIDDIEGGHVAQKANLAKDGYSSLSHNRDGAQDPKPVTSEKMEQDKSLELQFIKIDGKSGDSVGAALINENLDLKDYGYINFFIKGDGTNNVAHFEIEEAASAALGNDPTNKKGEIWRSNQKIELKDTNWRRVVIKLDTANFTRTDYYIGNGTLDKSIRGYKLSYYDNNADKNLANTKHYVDSVFAANEKDSVSVITASPKDLAFKANKNGAAPEAQKITLTNTGSKSIVVSSTVDQPTWLKVAPDQITIAAGKTAEITAQILKTDLEAKVYSAVIRIVDELAFEQKINVTYTVIDPNAPAKIGVAPATIEVEIAPDGSAITKNIAITNLGGGTLGYTLTKAATWLAFSKDSGSLASGAADVVVLTIDPKGLAAGAYTDSVVVTNNNDAKDTASVSIKLTVKSVVTADPKLNDIFPSQAYPGSTILISGENLKGGKVTVNGKEAKVFFDSDSLLKAVVPQDTPAGTATVKVTVNGKSVEKNITISDTGAIIDDMEGGHVHTNGYYKFAGSSGATIPEMTANDRFEGEKSIKIKFGYVSDWGDGVGAALVNESQDISKYPTVTFYLKGDGTDNQIRLDLEEAEAAKFVNNTTQKGGETWSSPLVALKDANWHTVTFNLADFKRNDSNAKFNNSFEKVIKSYKFTYVDSKDANASGNYHYADFLVAGTVVIPQPTKPVITAAPLTVEHKTTASDTQAVNYEIEVKNTGAGTLKYTVAKKDASVEWLKIASQPKDLAANESQKIFITFDPSKVARVENVYETAIVIEDPNAFNKKAEVKAILTISNSANILGLPKINLITPASGPVGIQVTIKGENFDFSDRRYKDYARVVFNKLLNLENVRVISPTEVTATIPMNVQPGKYTVYFNRRADLNDLGAFSAETDKIFEITPLTAITDVRPNPVNPLDPDPTNNKATIRITVTDKAGANVAIYIFDITGRLVWQKQAHYAGELTHEVAWDAKVLDGDLVGDGVYLVRVMNNDTKTLISKGKIVVIKK